ncbi:MAG: recombinase [Verrucomicrobia bacterium]|nr:recombinase [Verrucomicrobiota bacterium]
MTEYEKYEAECASIRKENMELLDSFALWLEGKGLSKSTAKKHRYNMDFYINEFLLYESPIRPLGGVYGVGRFLGYWFIRKAMWASETSIRSNAASLKKFYDFMLERGEVDQEAVNGMKATIKEDLPEWVARVRRYYDPSIEPEDVWQW